LRKNSNFKEYDKFLYQSNKSECKIKIILKKWDLSSYMFVALVKKIIILRRRELEVSSRPRTRSQGMFSIYIKSWANCLFFRLVIQVFSFQMPRKKSSTAAAA
jgi:hypothetical protein